MDSLSTLPTPFARYGNEARSALARYLEHAIAEQDQVAALVAGTADAEAARRRRGALAEARTVLDVDGLLAVPTMVIAGAVGHWQARFDAADALLVGPFRDDDPARWQIEKITALLAVNALHEVAHARGVHLSGIEQGRRPLRGLWNTVVRSLLGPGKR